jgi:xylulokinase
VATECLIGIDVGTTGIKAVLIDRKGRRLADYARPVAMSRPRPGFAEQDPADWMDGVLAALDRFAREHDLSGLIGIGICSQVNTHVFVDANGRPLMPAITWQDTRATTDAAALDMRITPQQKLDWFGAPIPIDASHALARLAYSERVHRDVVFGSAFLLLPKDYCVMQLTGAVGGDPVSAVGLTGADLRYVDGLLDLVPAAHEKLPPLHPFTHVAGRVRDGLPCAGVPVVTGVMDAWGGMFGTGVVADGDAMYQTGTSEIPGIVSSNIVPTPGVIVFPTYEGIWRAQQNACRDVRACGDHATVRRYPLVPAASSGGEGAALGRNDARRLRAARCPGRDCRDGRQRHGGRRLLRAPRL